MLWLDCVLFNGEPIAKARLEYLFLNVDFFYICEARYTHQGAYKNTLYIESCREWFAPYMSKVRFIVYDKPPGSRVYENEHRDAPVETILESHVGEKFVLSGCDIDEIPDLSTMPSLEEIHTLCSRGCVRLSQDFYYYNTKWRFAEKWTAPFFINERLLRGAGSIQKYRYENPYNTSMVLPCGWHFSYFQSVEDIRRKLESFCHKEYNSQKYKNREHIVKCIESGIDLFMRSNKKLIAAGAEGEALPEVFQRASLEIALLQRPLPPTDKN